MSTYLTIAAGMSAGGRRAKPTRDELGTVKESFQGLRFWTPSYGWVFWWETLAWWSNRADRDCAYAAKRAAGDTHCILDVTGCYKELPEPFNQEGADYSQRLHDLVVLAEEVIDQGFLIDLRLGGDGRSAPKNPDGSYPYNDPNGKTYGFEWLMENWPRIAAAFDHLKEFIVPCPGYDGVFYGWGDPAGEPDRQPERVQAFGRLVRQTWPDCVLGIEFSSGSIPVGGGAVDFAPGGRMEDYDVIYGEFDPGNYHQDSTWQVVARLVAEYHRPPDQPAGDDPNPPHYLAIPNRRGKWFFIVFEVITYFWTRGACSPQEPAAYRQYFRSLGATNLC